MTDETKPEIQVWETEDPTLVVWGTHDIDEILVAAKKFYTEMYELVLEVDAEELQEGGFYYWGDPNLPDEEEWPKDSYSDEETEGRIPFFLYNW